MSKRVFAVAAVVVVALVWAGGPASAQTYPAPLRSITVDDNTPTPGQEIVVTMQTCRAASTALIGIDLTLVGTPRVGADGVAQPTVTVPPGLGAGLHTVSGACLAPDLAPLVLRTSITVEAASAGGGSGRGGGAVPPPDGPAAPAVPPSLASLDGSEAPADAGLLYEETAAANGVTEGGGSAGSATAERSGEAGGDTDPGTLSTVARVALGVAALGGVPVALAMSRRPRRVVRQGFA